MSYDTIKLEKDNRVAILTLNRPERHNAFSFAMARELSDVWRVIKKDDDINCIVVTGAGERALCTGVDVQSVVEEGGFEEDRQNSDEKPPFLSMTAIQNQCWKPVITAVNGMVCGGGLHFVADSDIVVCAEHATFFDTHVKIGTIAGLEPVGLSRRMPFEAVMRMALLGGSERMTAERALSLGLVGEIVSLEQLMPRSIELAHKIAAHSPTALAKTKKAIWQSLDTGLSEANEHTWNIIKQHTSHPDQAEGTLALVEKRAPNWAPYNEE